MGPKNQATSRSRNQNIMEPLGTTKKIIQPPWTKNNHATYLYKKTITQPLGKNQSHATSQAKKVTQYLVTKKIKQPFGGKKNHATSQDKKWSCNLSGQKKSLNLSEQKKSCNLSRQNKSCNLSGQKNHASSLGKKNHAISLQGLPPGRILSCNIPLVFHNWPTSNHRAGPILRWAQLQSEASWFTAVLLFAKSCFVHNNLFKRL